MKLSYWDSLVLLSWMSFVTLVGLVNLYTEHTCSVCFNFTSLTKIGCIISNKSASQPEPHKEIMKIPEMKQIQEIVHRLCHSKGYNPWDIISLICQACKTLITSAVYPQPLVFWSLNRGVRRGYEGERHVTWIDLPYCIRPCGNLSSRLQTDRTFKLCLTAHQRPITPSWDRRQL